MPQKGSSVRVLKAIPEYGLQAQELVTVVRGSSTGGLESEGVGVRFMGRTRTDSDEERYTWGWRTGWLAKHEFVEVQDEG